MNANRSSAPLAAALALALSASAQAGPDFTPREGIYELEVVSRPLTAQSCEGIGDLVIDAQVSFVDENTLSFTALFPGTCTPPGGASLTCELDGRLARCPVDRSIDLRPVLDAVVTLSSFNQGNGPNMVWIHADRFVWTQDVSFSCEGTQCDLAGRFAFGGTTFPCAQVNRVDIARRVGDPVCPLP